MARANTGSPLAGVAICAVLAVVAAIGWFGGGSGNDADDGVTIGNWWGGAAGSPVAAMAGGSGAGADATAPPLPQGFAPTQGRDFAAGLKFAPIRSAFGAGWNVVPGSAPAVLAAYRLRPGDIVLELDSQPMTAARMAGLAEEMGRLDTAEITFVRDGRIRDRMLNFQQ